MLCKCSNNNFVDVVGQCDPDKFTFDTTDPNDLSFTEISIPEICMVPKQKPNIESIEKVFISVQIISKRVVETPETTTVSENAEGTMLTGRKLVIEGVLCQKIVYTADVCEQSVHSFHCNIPFSAFIIIPKEVETDVDAMDVSYCIETCVEDVFVKPFNGRQVFKNVTLFLKAKPVINTCP